MEARSVSTIATKDATEVYYEDQGRGPPIAFSRGWPFNGDARDDKMMFMALRGFRCVVFDRRGHGRSIEPWDGNKYDTFAVDLSALIGALDLKAATLVGHSAGAGYIARWIGSGRAAGAACDTQDKFNDDLPIFVKSLS